MISREKTLIIIALVLVCLSISLNFKVWIYDYYWLYLIPSKKVIIIKPTLITTMISVFLLGGYIIRNINDIFNDVIKILFCIIDIIFFSGFIAMFANSKTNIFGFSSQGLLVMAIILMWLGLKSISRYVILSFISLSTLFISQLNEVMGFFGALYILFAFLSFSLKIYTNILPNVSNLKSEFFGEKKKQNDDECELNEQ